MCMGCKLLTLTNCIKVSLGCFVSHILGPKFLIKPRIGVICLMLQPPQLPVFPLCFQPRNLSGCSCQVTAWHTDSPYKQPLLTPRLLALNTSFFFQARFHFQFYDAAYLRPWVVTCIIDKFSQPKIWWWLFFTLKETSNQQSFGALSTNQTWRGAGIYQLYPKLPADFN